MPLSALQGDGGPEALLDAVVPVLRHLGDTKTRPSPSEVPVRPLDVLLGRPWLNQVLTSTSEQARPLGELAEIVFPDSPKRRKATEVLLSLGTLARRAPDDPSLLPTRIHLMFRGIAGIWACLDPVCPGRQERPGEEAPLGKLFATPRVLCDACGARVFELASCRNCGGAYVIARVEAGKLDSARFFWGEAAGDLETIEILPTRPRNEEGVEEAAIHLTTGHLVSPAEVSRARVRRIWLPRDRETGRRRSNFVRCPLCQPPGLPLNVLRKAFITDLQTRGEQPFTALIEAQFAEQPPQKRDESLPNRGRKVLVFSDGRQRAARLAPALEMSHSRDAFRQVLLLAARELAKIGRSPGIASMFPALLQVCTKRSIDLFPTADEAEFHDRLAHAGRHDLETLLHHGAQNIIQPTLSYAKSLFAELTDRYFSLQAMGLATIEEEPTIDYIFNDFPDVGLSQDEVRRMFRSWIRVQLERRCFLPPGASLSQLGEQWERPNGIRLDDKHDFVPIRFAEWLNETIGEEGTKKVTAWFVSLARSKGFLLLLNDAYYLQPSLLVLRPRVHEPWLRCTSCSRLDVHVVRDRCIDCRGKMIAADDELYLDARYGFYRDQVERALRGDSVEPFVSVNLGAVPRELAAAELFGAHKGAYTGATRDREGFFRAARGGTLFLDEVGEAPPEVQVMLLRVLETGEMYPVGAQVPVATDVRLIAATDANLEQRIRDGHFKAPLLHRLAGYEIRLPALRERREDIGGLFYHFAREELEAIGEVHRLSPEDPYAEPWLPASLAAQLVRFDWPGNIRQLRNMTRQLVIGHRGRAQLTLDPRMAEELSAGAAKVPSARRSEADAKGAEGDPKPHVLNPGGKVQRKPAEITEAELLAALREGAWDMKAAADRLGIPRSSIYDIIDRCPGIRTAGNLSTEEITRCFEACGGDLDEMVRRLEVSGRALKRRIKELGLGAKRG